jgi:D-alanyl-D-alanine dipeptidase
MNNLELEKQMVKYVDLSSMKVEECNDKFVYLYQDEIPNCYLKKMDDMAESLNGLIALRKRVKKRLMKAQKNLKKLDPQLSLFLTYGYRSLEVQTSKFQDQLAIVNKKFYANPIELYEEVHRYVAVPSVAGHPTGGAVDIMIVDKLTNPLNFGSKIYDFSNKKLYAFSELINREALKNRLLLRSVLMNVGFAPFDGEWWHFSYGDKEWAYYYKKKVAIYDQKTLHYVVKKIV